MLTEMIRPVGHALRGIRAGMAGLATHQPWIVATPECIALRSPAFGGGFDIPERFTADGAGLFPPLSWHGVPEATRSLLLLVEDPDVPFVTPLAHLLAYGLPPTLTALAEGAIPRTLNGAGPDGLRCGRNSATATGWLPPSPPPGHGPHHYAFQLLALDMVPAFATAPGRGKALAQVRGHVLGWGLLFGVYERG